MVEIGMGDNTYHDLPVRKEMGWGAIQEALWEGRIKVRWTGLGTTHRSPQRIESAFPEGQDPVERLVQVSEALSRGEAKICGKEIHWFGPNGRYPKKPGIPGLVEIEALFQKGALPLSVSGKTGFLIDEYEDSIVRVRWCGESADRIPRLEEAQRLLTDYVTAITPSWGLYGHGEANLMIFPKPGATGGWSIGNTKHNHYPTLTLTHAMILEEVWEGLLALQLDPWEAESPKDFEGYLLATRQLYEAEQKASDDIRDVTRRMLHPELLANPTTNPIVSRIYVAREGVPISFGLREHWILFCRKGLPIEQAEPFLRSVAEMCFFLDLAQVVGFMWTPTSASGSQCSDWGTHLHFQDLFRKVVAKRISEEEDL